MVLWTKLWYYGENYGTIPNPMELLTSMYLKNFDLLSQNYGTMEKTMKQ